MRVGFICDGCGLHWASKRKNEVDGQELCDDCTEEAEEKEEEDPMTKGRKKQQRGSGQTRGRGGGTGGRRP